KMTGQADITATAVTVVSDTKITCTFDLTGKKAGQWNVEVTNTNQMMPGTLNNGFTVRNAVPTVTGITPNSGKNTGTINITNLAGTNFIMGATVTLRKGGSSIMATN